MRCHVYQQLSDLTFFKWSLFRDAAGRAVIRCVNIEILLRQDGIDRFSLKRRFDWLLICILVKIGPLMSKSGCKAGFGRAGYFLDPFLTETICKRSSNQADYTPNR